MNQQKAIIKRIDYMSEKKEKGNGGFWQFVKFALFSASAGIIQVAAFTLMSEVIIKLPVFQNWMDSNATFAKIMQNKRKSGCIFHAFGARKKDIAANRLFCKIIGTETQSAPRRRIMPARQKLRIFISPVSSKNYIY